VTSQPTSPATLGASPANRTQEPGRDWIDTAIEWTSGLAAVGMFAYGVALSYAVLHAIAAAAGLPAWAARVWPLGFEAFMASAALNALAEQRHRRHQPDRWARVAWYPWTLTGLTAGASIALNWCHPAIPLDPPPGWLVSVVYGLPPLIAVLAWHLFLGRVTHRRQQPSPAAVVLAVPGGPVGDGAGDRWDGASHHDDSHGTSQAAQDGPDAPADRTVPDPPDPGRDGPGRTASGGPPPGPDRPAPRPWPARPASPPAPSRPAAGDGDGGLLARARTAAAHYQAAHGRPIGRDALRRALRVSNQTASDLLRALRAPTTRDRDGTGTVPVTGPQPAAPDRAAAPPAGGTVPANGHPDRPVTLTSLVPTSPGPADGGEVAGDA
jgi:hypothetical protein